jgi:hypothetical protein
VCGQKEKATDKKSIVGKKSKADMGIQGEWNLFVVPLNSRSPMIIPPMPITHIKTILNLR